MGELKRFMESNGLEEFDEVEFLAKGKIFKGWVMPKSVGDPDSLVIKMRNGYNVAIPVEDIKWIRKTGKLSLPERKAGNLKFREGLPEAALVSTGGTIASKLDYRTGGVYALEDPAELLEMVPEIGERIRISEISRPFTKMSEDMELKDYPKMAGEIYRHLKNGRSVIVTHGTDTLHFSTAAMTFMIQNPSKPVVFVGSQRSTDRPSSDAWMNLSTAAVVAGMDISEIGVNMHASTSDDFSYFIRGTKVRKMHTSRRDAFRPINSKPLLKVWKSGKVEFLSDVKKPEGRMELKDKISDRAVMLEVYPSRDPDVLEYYREKGYEGFIIKATALGHVPTFSSRSWIEPIRKLVREGKFVGIVSQTLYGEVNPYVYTNLRLLKETGALFLGDMLPETAYIKLSWALAYAEGEELERLMLENIAGEFSDRRLDTFLY